MKITNALVLVVLMCIVSSCGKTDVSGGTTGNKQAAGAEAATNDADFVTYCEDLDATKQTQIYVREHWKKLKNIEVTWTGKVKDVRSSRNTATIYIDKDERPTYRGYNVILQVSDLQAAGTLKKKQRLKFKGQLSNYKDARGGIIIFTVESGEILEALGE